ncbi:hypothetical protein [Cellulomonas sp. ICMP 17802]|uniref:hypothetical protein n=1 Tax=Cellulomonas sp. ICMP 17802 TaxID=3239199 RepID=UPI00351AEA8A
MTWQDLLGVRWRWRPRKAVRVVVATAVTVAVVAPLLLALVLLCLGIGVLWTGVLVATALLFLWIAEKWWVVVDPENLLLWLKLLPGIWSWAHEDALPAHGADAGPETRSNPSISQEHWSARPW